ncbi:hypothetical protein Scep_020553 [Stephania cephalantha]|uniref:Oxidoreductase-like domain-containing protein n=1 Tax=Stephania cephalantha TaxID=152367 RepID=A0AAP0NP35_9MAGN
MNLSCINTVTPQCHKKLHTSLANKVRKGGQDSLLMIGRTTTLQPNLVNLRNRVNAVVATKANLRIAVVDMADSTEKKQSEEPSVEKKPEVAPPPPEKPLPGDCCGSGCVRCVWDVYYEELEEYNNRIKSCSGNDDRSKKS